jgi:class 3 adenylate cyclase
VNVASRLLEVAKERRVAVVASEAVFAAVPLERRAALAAGFCAPEPTALRGRAGLVAVRLAVAVAPAGDVSGAP